MFNLILVIIVGLFGGIAASLQGPFNGIMGQRLGNLESVFITYVGGGILIAVITVFMGGGNLSGWRSLPWYVFLAGPLGLVIIGSLSYTVPRLGIGAANAVFIATLFIIGAIFDHFGWFGVDRRPLEWTRILGVITLMIGTWLMLRE